MSSHRFLDLIQAEVDAVLANQPIVESGFMVCPLILQASNGFQDWQHKLYQWAFEQARAVVRPSRLERCYAQAVNVN